MPIIKLCPICGDYPQFEKTSMDYGNGHGYPGNFFYYYHCINCNLVKGDSFDTVYNTDTEARDKAIKSWDKRVDEIEQLLKWRDTK